MSKVKIDKKKLYLYATPLAFVFGIVFGTLFIAYVVVAQSSYFSSDSFVLKGGQILNYGTAPVALMIPQGTVGIGTSNPDYTNYDVDIVGDTLVRNSLVASSTVSTSTISRYVNVNDEFSVHPNGSVNIGSPANFDSSVNFAAATTILGDLKVKTSDGALVNLADVFYLSETGDKIWIDGSLWSWEYSEVYNSSKANITTDCKWESWTSQTGYQVSTADDQWYEMECVLTSNSSPYCISYKDPATRLADSGFWQNIFNMFVQPATAEEWPPPLHCNYVWRIKDPQPVNPAMSTTPVIKIKAEYLP